MRVDASFEKTIQYLDLESIEHSTDVTYIVDAGLMLRAFNPAWVSFAQKNGGHAVLTQYPLGSDVSGAFPQTLRPYLLSAYKAAMEKERPFTYDYECPSPICFRKFHQSAYPLARKAGLVISNHLVEERPHDQHQHSFGDRFRNEHGMVTQCCNCRKLRDPSDTDSWLWVPEAVARHFPGTTHAICPRCYDFYYPETDE